MNSITVLLVLFAGIALKLRAVQASTVDVSNTRPALIWYVNKTKQSMFYYQNNNKSWSQCYGVNSFPSHAADFQHGYTSDLEGVYDLREIIVFMSTNVASFNVSSLHIYIDRTECDDFKIKTSSHLLISVTLKCGKTRGRTVTVLSGSRSICNLQVLACGSGLTGENCDRACSGRYGISCSLPCRCVENSYCDRHTGFCAHGCANSGGNRHNDCFFKSIEMNSRGFYTDFSQSDRTVTTSHPYTGNTKSCYSVQFSKTPEGRLFWIEWKFTSLKTLKAIEFDFNNNRSIGSAVLGVAVDSRSCLVESLHNSSMSRRRQCHNGNLRGRSVRLTISTKDDDSFNLTGSPLSSICHVKLLACHSGYYGPACRMPCNCLILPCHPETGLCTDDKCMPGYKGRNCGQVDLAKMDDVFTTEEAGTVQSLPALFPLGPVPYDMDLFNPDPLWTTVKAVELPGTFRVNHVTVTLHPSVASIVSNISVYMDTEPTDGAHSHKIKPQMTGLPCVESYPIVFTPDPSARNLVTTTLECPGFASVLTVVVIGATSMSDDVIHDVGVWTCVDGTFGHGCDRVCNCRQPWDVCDVDTGQCLDSCPSTHGGASCQKVICPSERCILSCPEGWSGCHKTCIAGWMGASCETPCPDGFYGDGCLKTCGWCSRGASDGKACDARTGVCFHGCQSSHPLCDDYMRAVLSGSQPDPSERSSPETGTTSKAGTIALLSILTVCLLVFVLATCLGKKHSNMASGDQSGSRVADHVQTFHTIHEGWQWVESVNRMRGFDISCDTCSTGDLTHIQKVAIWILCQDFKDSIVRRQKKLQMSGGSVSDTVASHTSVSLDEDLEDFDGIA